MTKKQPIPFGKYLLLDRVNIGGMAEVWKAKTFGAEGFEKLVAIKRILPNIAEDEEFITMFIDEAKISVQLTHANIAQVFDLGKIGDSYYIAMEYVSGKDLRAIFDKARKRGEPAPIPLVCYCLSKAAEGLDYAHRKRDAQGQDLNIVHRDVSPQNILCSYDGETKVIDFGIAKAANKATKTQAGILKGKFGYMSPEQVRGLPLDRRSDVFALGVVLYEMLTGERLFVGDSDFSVLEKVRAVDILPPSTYNRRIPPALEKIVLKALAKDVEDRYSYASELGDELQRFLITNDTIFSRKDLMQFMKSTFAEDVEREKLKLAEYAEIKLPPGMAALAGLSPVAAAPRVSNPGMPALAPPVAPPVVAPAVESTVMLAESGTAPAARAPAAPPRATGIRPAVNPPAAPGNGAARPGPPPAVGARPGPPVMAPPKAAPGAPPGRQMTASSMNAIKAPPAAPARPPAPPPVAAPPPEPEPELEMEPDPEPASQTGNNDIGAALDDELNSSTVSVPPPPRDKLGLPARGQAHQQHEETAVRAAPQAPESSGGGKSKLPLLLGVAAVVLLLGLGAGGLLLTVAKPTGAVLLSCTPSENLVVLIDGQQAGTSTPLTRDKLEPGPHTISVTSKGYEIVKQQFTVEAHQTQPLDITLKKKGEAGEEEKPKEAPKAAAPVVATIVRETEGAEVSLDGKVIIAKDAKDAIFADSVDGSVKHLVEAKRDGFKAFQASFEPGQPIKIKVALEKAK